MHERVGESSWGIDMHSEARVQNRIHREKWDTSPSLFLSLPAWHNRKKPGWLRIWVLGGVLWIWAKILTLESSFPCLQNGIGILCSVHLRGFGRGSHRQHGWKCFANFKELTKISYLEHENGVSEPGLVLHLLSVRFQKLRLLSWGSFPKI